MRADRFLSRRVSTVLFAVVLLCGAPVHGQDLSTLSSAAFQPPLQIDLRPVETPRQARGHQRPAALMPLYGSLVALQGLDIHSTRRGMSSGKTREANPVMGPVVGNSAAFIAVKAAVTAGAIWTAEKLWKKHPKRAVIFTVLLNATMAAVVTHNYRLGT